MLGLVALTIGIVLLLPKITKAVPASLVSIIIVFGILMAFGIETKTVKDIASVSGGFPPFHLPEVPFNLDMLKNNFTLFLNYGWSRIDRKPAHFECS